MSSSEAFVYIGKTRISVTALMAINPDSDGYRTVEGIMVCIGNGARIGNRASIGNGASIGDEARIGDGASIGDGAQQVLCDLGAEQGRKYGRCAYISKEGIVIIQAGCHHFTIVQARDHWGSPDYPDKLRGSEYLALVDYVEHIAKLRWY